MAAESPIRMLQTQESWTSHKGPPTFSADEEALLVKGYRYLGGRGVVLNRSGSAPPNMEGSLASIENIIQNSGLSSEREFRGSEGRLVSSSSSVSDNSPYSDLVFQFHHQHLGSNRFGKLTPFSGSSDNLLHLSRSSLPTHEEESEDDRSPQKTDNFTYRSSAVWSGQESFPSIGQSINIANLKDGSTNMSSLSDDQSNTLHHGSASDGTNTRDTDSSSLQEQSISYDSRQGSSPSIHSHEDPSITNILPENKISFSDETDITSVQNRMKALKISCPPNSENYGIRVEIEPNFQTTLIQRPSGFQFPHSMPQIASQGTNNSYIVANQFFHGGNIPSTEAQPVFHSSTFTPPLHMPSSPYYANVQPPGIIYPPHYYMSGYPYNANVIPPFLSGYPPHNAFDINTQAPELWGGSSQGVDIQHANRFYGHAGFPQPLLDPRLQVQPHHSFGDSMGTPRSSSNTGLFMHLSHSPLSSPVLPQSPMGSGSSPSSVRSASAHPGWQGLRGFEGFHYKKPYSFLEDLKSGKGRRFELSDIAGHVVEFSVDQHGSRFIQQKLENCSIEDKASVFQEVLPHASKLMTDVFGNYVIQKFFEYGTPEQRRDLANALRSQILPLSLQMYGCRVIQKALDVIELEQKAELVRELDGHVMRCVRDQNGNHVIQKCIECIPTDKISFMIYAFRGQVPSLSMHPYGCRVIQRVLERCTSELQSQFIVDEILESVCTLAQDQYGNYVTQHVLERGKPQERTQIIKNLGGQVVKMSQHKFASNVVEKCLEYGEPDARELLIVEVIGQDDVNDNLLVMMKDQYANYVVQKILETCTESQREQLLRRIRVHLHSLKKYTYGKHIAVRFEQLIGESVPPAAGS